MVAEVLERAEVAERTALFERFGGDLDVLDFREELVVGTEGRGERGRGQEKGGR